MYPFTRVAMPQRTPFTQGCRYLLSLLIAACFLVGCGKSSDVSHPPTPDSQLLTPNSSPSLRLHWLGKKRLSAESNATNFISIWNMPESLRLENQTLDKLSTAPWRLLTTTTLLSNAPTALLRPLLDDVLQEETYIEVLAGTNQSYEAVLAIKLPPDRAALWQTNLPIILKSLSSSPSPNSYLPSANSSLTLTNIGNWTILSISDLRLQASKLSILPQIRHRLATAGIPYEKPTTNYWIRGEMDNAWLNLMSRRQIPLLANLRRCDFAAIGDGSNVRSRLGLEFDKPLPLDFSAWNIPTNIISDQLVSFTAFRTPDVGLWKNVLNADLGKCFSRKQVFVWALKSLPMATYVAVPIDHGSGCFDSLGKHLFGPVNDWIATNAIGSFAPSKNGDMIAWQGIPYLSAYFQSLETPSGNFVIGGLATTPLTNRAPSLEIMNRMMQRTNLLYYDWEYSGPRVESWFYIGQLGRVIFGRPQLTGEAVTWLKAVGAKLGNAGTVAILPDANHISIERFSTLGMSAVELHLFADLLESTNFPSGFHTTSTPAKPMLRRKTPLPGAPN